MNPYHAAEGPELDRLIHEGLFGAGNGETPPQYSSDPRTSARVKAQLERRYGYAVAVGQTEADRHFARLESGPSTATEALAGSRPLAICRLAAVLLARP